MHRPALTLAASAVGSAAVLALSGCGGSASGSASSDGKVTVVASTDVWGDVAASVGGPDVTVTSLISGPGQDPHSFEATTRDQLRVKDADVVIENGGGYDEFMNDLVEASGTTAPVVDAVAVSGLEGSVEASQDDDAHDSHDAEGEDDSHDHGEFNEHVWYDLPTAGKVAQAVAKALGEADPDHAATYTANAQAFVEGLAPVEQQAAAVKAAAQAAGTVGVGITEPVPDRLLDLMGISVVTPTAFSEAVEEGDDVAPAVLADTEAQYRDGTAAALVYNEQTTGSQTEAVLAAAKAAGVPVVPVTETLPKGQDYTQWMTANVEAIRAAVRL